MSIISNSSPLIFLGKIGRLDILEKLFVKVYIPQAVYDETVLPDKDDDVSRTIVEKVSLGQFEVFKVGNEVAIRALAGRLHLGEIEVIIGADELNIRNVILDDVYARNKAKQFELSVTGTLGILLLAFNQGFIEDIELELQRLMDIGFRISNDLLRKIISQAKGL